MSKFLFSYHGGGGMPESEEERAKLMAAWGEWYGANGAAFTDTGNPVAASMTVGPDGTSEGGAANPVTGYALVDAPDIAAACAIAAACPIVTVEGGSVEVGETFEVAM